jgi:hypothetical protein
MRVVLLFSLSLWFAGCAINRSFIDEPIIDRKGVEMSRYYTDKAECQAYADDVRIGKKVARGAVGGAVVGGAIGAIVNRDPDSAERGTGVGAITGGVRGAQQGVRESERVFKQCLRGRGYRVLN